MPFFGFYLGATRIVPDDDSRESEWFSSLSYAVGVRYYFREWLGVLVQNRGTSSIITDSESLLCDDDDRCIRIPKDTWMWQIDVSAGVIFAF